MTPAIKRFFPSVLACCLLLGAFATAYGQSMRNEWIDHNKTYYRFPVTPSAAIPSGAGDPLAGNHLHLADYNSLYRIPYSTLEAAGLQNIPVEQFQMWRNGSQVAIYTYPATGLMGPDGYIEIWGQHNDGNTDRDLYRQASHQIHNRWSMFSDTAWYYLTVNAAGNNLRITDAPNNALSSTLVPDSFFMHTITVSPRTHRNLGFATSISGQELRSSTFSEGEGWATRRSGNLLAIPLNQLFPFRNSNQQISVRYSVQGGSVALLESIFTLELNDSALGTRTQRNYRVDSVNYTNIPLSRISDASNGSVNIEFNSSNGAFVYNLAKVQFTYPRRFQFNNTDAAFQFSLAANAAGNLLKIAGFDNSGHQKILLDLTNRRRYTAVMQGDTLLFELEPSATARTLVLTTLNLANPAVVRNVSTVTPRTFQNFGLAGNQGDYLIISNQRLFDDNGANRVEEYRQYRSSDAGGGYNAKVYTIDELTEQFAFNILKHPLAIRNFLRYARANFPVVPKAAFLIGRGASYEYAMGNAQAEFLNLVPTWGHPASDNLLAASTNESITPAIPIGRLGAITGAEVKDYLDKVKAFEAIQSDPDSYKAWQKKTLHLIGGTDATIVDPIRGYMNKYTNIISDTLVGANVSTYERLNNPNTAANNQEIQQAVTDGAGIISYFGHSSATSIDFNLNNPSELDMTPGRLPVFIANGCKASEFFDLNTLRYNQTRLTLSESFVLAKDKGSIAFLSSTHFGVLQYLDYFTERWYKAAASSRYGKSLGELHQEAIRQLLLSYTTFDAFARLTAEEYHLHGDPAVRIHPLNKPDYIIDSTGISFSPLPASVATDTIRYQALIRNDGKAVKDTIQVRVTRILPDGTEQSLASLSVPRLTNSRVITGSIPVRGPSEAGWNALRIEVDYTNKADEYVETNNQAIRHFNVETRGLTPVIPANFSIMNTWPAELVASSFETSADSGLYRLEMDTTTIFNSPLLYSLEDSSRNGVVRFMPQNSLLPGTVYYWRTAQIHNGVTGPWRVASFTYRPGDGTGFSQGHFYQHLQSGYQTMYLDSLSRRFAFRNKPNNLYITHGIFPTSGTEDLHFSVIPNGSSSIYSACIGQSIIFNVFDSLSFAAFINPKQVNETVGNCAPGRPGRSYNFEFPYHPASNRKRIMDFMDSVPTGYYMVARLVVDPPYDSLLIDYWKRDTAIYGPGNSLYHRFLAQGFYDIDSMTRTRTFSVVYRQNDTTSFRTQSVLSDGRFDRPVLSVDIPMIDTTGTLSSPWIGPASHWSSFTWRPEAGYTEPNGNNADSLHTWVLGRTASGRIDTLFTLTQEQDLAFSGSNAIAASTYPYLQLVQRTNDSDNATPNQLSYWRVYYDPAPEGAFVPGEHFRFNQSEQGRIKDTLTLYYDTLQFGIAFRNIGTTAYADSLSVTIFLEDSAGNRQAIPYPKLRPLPAGDSVHLFVTLPTTESMQGKRKLYVSVNGKGEQPELSLVNNAFYHEFHVLFSGMIPGTKIFNGTGNWSDGSRWTPAGVPTCADKVRINGHCTVDIGDAVSDSLLVNTGGTLLLAQPDAKLNIGCSDTGGNKMITIRGTLHLQAGSLQVNGGLLLHNAGSLIQSGGSLVIDPNTGHAAHSLQTGMVPLSQPPLPMASFSIGGPDTVGLSHGLGERYSSGTISLT
ncbi:MAG: C25 family cysteine peptidase, partial [Chitinophagaceae bacterium]|nr:C25 family cysteine peptidase [Chitinophagaceae bacterium]